MDIRRNLIKTLKTEVENFIKDNFKNESFGNEKWEKRKTQDRSDRNRPNERRRLLTKTSRLLRSIKVRIAGSNKVVVTSDTPYASTHNKGFKGEVKQSVRKHSRKRQDRSITVKAHDRTIKQNIPKRQFVGKHKVLDDSIKKAFEKEVKRFLDSKFKR